MKVKELLRNLDLGNSVAEFDTDLENYFLETETFRTLIHDKVDIIAGDKGTGKTAIYRILQRRYNIIKELDGIEVVTGFNPSGNPIFQRLAEGDKLTEGQYITVWKAYILSLLGNWTIDKGAAKHTTNTRLLENLLNKTGLRTSNYSPSTVFSQITELFQRLVKPKSTEASVSFDQQGLPTFSQKVELGDSDQPEKETVRHEDALRLLNDTLFEADIKVWIVLDRLDEAFQGFPKMEIPALRALLRTYLDLLEFENIILKLFVRRDLFRKVTQGGFVNLTHINARKIEIIWEDEDLFEMLYRRITTANEFTKAINVNINSSSQQIFDIIFPDQVDAGNRKPKTWTWILSRIRDGANVKAPRNLIDLVKKAQESQLRKEERDNREYIHGTPIIEADAIKRALTALSHERVKDTLLAESGDYSSIIDKFRDGKAEHNEKSISVILGENLDQTRETIKILISIGFLEPIGTNYKVPILYRDGLGITQGKAF
jgi:hypothetical protein